MEEEITNEDSSEPVLNVAGWLTRTTMDVLGEGTLLDPNGPVCDFSDADTS